MQRLFIHSNAAGSKRRLLLGASFLLLAGAAIGLPVANAADATKDALIHKVEVDSMRNTVFTPDSPLLDSMLAPAKAANPNVSADNWAAVRADTASAITSTLFGPDSAVSTVMEQSLSQLSTQELQHLDVLLTDPVLIKFQHTMASPETQRALMQGMAASTLKMQGAMNDVLLRHGLKVPSP
ncbi:hypothetical protein [Dyella caseinilytica]|uniref:DUF4142 domain-containing protein n=1 Tax=Dyella caseinilytica TaxID=1849581 RepID=A0ABX7GTV8_9GAMM|nr:hypothetical protein [Dyella caseinilytica]QRN53872.1 hypothetical protein ISN74_00150 [Dyella caseinilytica]GFZ89755.1 hypothetical protein GCM10011408_06000 [Dyella caseinilytica]